MEIGIQLAGERRVEAAFETFPERARQLLVRVVADKTAELEALVRGAVPKRKGRLAAEIQSKTYDNERQVTGVVFVAGEVRGDFGKAGALEYGSHKMVKLRGHMMKLDHLFGRAMAGRQVSVKEHRRHTNIRPHDFLRGPLGSLRGPFVDAVMAAVEEAAAE